MQIGQLSAIPYAAGAVAMLLWSRRSDQRRERGRHFAGAACVAAAGFAVLASGPGLAVGVAAACLAFAGLMSAVAVYWTVPLALMSGIGAALGIGVIHVVADFGVALTPPLLGLVLRHTGELRGALVAQAGLLLLAAVLLPFIARAASPMASRRKSDDRRPKSAPCE
jgi:hypothetical protein